ncbi:HORMA domain-containing protein 1 isoform X2 [Cynoglossus semilaevis]|uniref:HORMA domain containing 1 n=1 Tax=Cynoglossus semilaevis TaxID=244447 RepID=A0A3P8VI27_CYNSE|nr:HORMA domain-containing protein 1 isoform X2 [Cynoglossus semilaevis]
MACVQRQKTTQNTQLLPNQVFTEQQSLVVIKKLLAISVSGITYLRGLFPEKAYGNKYIDDQKVMILREERSCPGASQIVLWMQGCFDAIEKKYLRIVFLSIYTDQDHPEKVTEFYQFRIQYTAQGAQMDFESKNNNYHSKMSTMSSGDTKKASILLVRKLYTLMQNLGPLPDNIFLNMKLAYYDNVTPQNYQPPGFKEADTNTLQFEMEPVKLTMGEVKTPFHTLKMDMATERHRLEEVEESVKVTDEWVLEMEEESVLSQSHMIEDVEGPASNNTDSKHTEIQMSCNETEILDDVTEVGTLVKRTSDMEVDVKRMRSGRVISTATESDVTVNKPTALTNKMICQYNMPSSQETPSTTTSKRKRKFSEPKDQY